MTCTTPGCPLPAVTTIDGRELCAQCANPLLPLGDPFTGTVTPTELSSLRTRQRQESDRVIAENGKQQINNDRITPEDITEIRETFLELGTINKTAIHLGRHFRTVKRFTSDLRAG